MRSEALVCVVTSRRRLIPAGSPEDFDPLITHIRAAAAAGVDLIQLREPDLEGGALASLTRRAMEAIRGTSARLLVNDRADVALAAGAHGVHLRAASMSAARLRRITPPGFLIGRSVHSAADAVAAEREGGLDYLLAGTVYPSASKPAGHPTLAVTGLARIVLAVSLPVLAIGGIALANMREVASTGARGIAAIGLFHVDERDGEAIAKHLAEIVQSMRISFDTEGLDPYHKRRTSHENR